MIMTKIALITGAGSGIGRSCAVRLSENGYSLVLCGRRLAALEETAALCHTESTIECVSTDVTKESDVIELFKTIKSRFGRLDVIFNNAGISAPATPFEDSKLEDFSRVVDINLIGMYLVARSAYQMMKDQSPQGGRIINNGSISSYTPRPYAVAYNMTKHAVLGLTKTLSVEGRANNIACGQIDIGNTATDMTAKMERGMRQADGRNVPEPTFDVTHVADALLYMSNLPLSANVQTMTVMATAMPLVGRG